MSPFAKPVSRRGFLRSAGAGLAATAAGLVLPASSRVALASEPASAERVGILIDVTRCIGCEACTEACKNINALPNPKVPPKRLDEAAYTFIDQRRVVSSDGKASTQFVKRQCMHCEHPACVSACTVGALTKSANGPVVYDTARCFGCRYCQYACPFGVPTYDWYNPVGLIHKCELCKQLLKDGQQPACSASCPTGALRFGTREMILAQARAQIDSNPGRYVDHIYGEHEVGGTSKLYIAGVPFAQLGFPTLSGQTISQTAETVMGLTPITATVVAAIATAGYQFTKRRGHAGASEGASHGMSPAGDEAPTEDRHER